MKIQLLKICLNHDLICHDLMHYIVNIWSAKSGLKQWPLTHSLSYSEWVTVNSVCRIIQSKNCFAVLPTMMQPLDLKLSPWNFPISHRFSLFCTCNLSLVFVWRIHPSLTPTPTPGYWSELGSCWRWELWRGIQQRARCSWASAPGRMHHHCQALCQDPC